MIIDAPGYLLRLESGIAAGTALLPGAFTESHRAYIERCMLPDGGFPDRRGGADMYYTAFGLRAAAVLGVLLDAGSGQTDHRARRRALERPSCGLAR